MVYRPPRQRRPTGGGWSRRTLLLGAGAGAVAITVGALAAYSFVTDEHPPCCPVPHPRLVSVVFDATDPLTENQLHAPRTALRARLEGLAVGDVITIDLIVPSQQGPLKPLFSQRKPKTGAQVNPLFENPALIQRDYDAFVTRFEGALDAVAAVKTGSRTSPICEAIWALAKRGPVDEIELWSDMVNNSATVNHFVKRLPRFDANMTRKLAFTNLEALRGATVTINQLAFNTSFQTGALRAWWDLYWRHAGVGRVSWTQVPA